MSHLFRNANRRRAKPPTSGRLPSLSAWPLNKSHWLWFWKCHSESYSFLSDNRGYSDKLNTFSCFCAKIITRALHCFSSFIQSLIFIPASDHPMTPVSVFLMFSNMFVFFLWWYSRWLERWVFLNICKVRCLFSS